MKGIYFKRNKWQVRIKVNDKIINCGTYEDKNLAGHVYDYHALKYNRALNFPDFDYTNWKPPEKLKPIKICKFKKLGMEKAQLLREDSNYLSPVGLSKKYKITLAAVYRILNNLTYKVKKPSNVKLGGSSTLEVIYNPSIADSVLAL